MALQGTIETFPLTDVLTLLGSSSKTGKLLLAGDRGTGCVWVEAGAVIGGSVAERDIGDAARLVFELMRFSDGAFEFATVDEGDKPPVELEPRPLAESLTAASQLLEEWRAIEKIVPTMAHCVHLAAELPAETVTIDDSRWSMIVAVGRGSRVEAIAVELALDEFSVCAAVASLVEDGLATIAEPAPLGGLRELVAAGSDGDSSGELQNLNPDGYSDDPEFDAFGSPHGAGDSDPGDPPSTAAVSFPDRFPIDDLLDEAALEYEDPWSSPEVEQSESHRREDSDLLDGVQFGSLPPIESAGPGEEGDSTDIAEPRSGSARSTAAAWDEMVEPELPSNPSAIDSTDEVLRQMSKLSPKAAEAIAAALSTVPAVPGSGDVEPEGGTESDGATTFFGSF